MLLKLLSRVDGLRTVRAMPKIPVHIIGKIKDGSAEGQPSVTVPLRYPVDIVKEYHERKEKDGEDSEETVITFDMAEG